MNINTNLKLRDRSKVTLGGFKGLDTLSSPINVSAIHSTEMKNLICRDGVNHKRYGWKTKYRIRDNSSFPKIQGIFNFNLDGEDFVIVYANCKFFKEKDGSLTSFYTSENLLEQECKCYVNDNKAYFIGCGDFLVFGQFGTEDYEMKRVVDIAYIPTTTENIGSEEDGLEYKRVTAEERNLLSPYIKNTLFGAKELVKEGDTNEEATYYLDKVDATELEVSIERLNGDNREILTLKPPTEETEKTKYEENQVLGKVEVELGAFNCKKSTTTKKLIIEGKRILGVSNGTRVWLIIKEKTNTTQTIDNETYTIPKTIIAQVLVYVEGASRNTTLTTFETSVKIDGTEATLKNNILVLDLLEYGVHYQNDNVTAYRFGEVPLKNGDTQYASYDKENNKLTLFAVSGDSGFYAPITPDVPNITVKLNVGSQQTLINSLTISSLFGLQGVHDRLFLADGNTIRWSKDNDFTYFGDKSYLTCGNSDTKLIGLEKQNDSTLLAVKEFSAREQSIFVITGKLDARTIDGREDYSVVFTPHAYQVGTNALGQVVNFNGECLMVGKDGLYAVKLGENMTVDSRYILPRSKQISNKLSKFNLENAKCIAFDNKFYLAINNECYVADNGQITNVDTNMVSTSNYEWWRWTNIPVNVWGYIDNKLCFGTDDGQICEFTENYYDEEVTELSAGLIAYDTNEDETINGFAISENIKVEDNDKFVINCSFYGSITTSNFEVVGNETRFYVPLRDYKKDEIIIINDTEYTIGLTDDYFSISEKIESNSITYYKSFNGITLDIKLKDNGNSIELFYNGEKVVWKSVGTNYNPSINDFVGTLHHKEVVEALWISGAMDLGTTVYSKTLTNLILIGERNLANHLKYGIATRLSTRDFEHLRNNNRLDFFGLNLETFSTDSDFASSYSKKLNMRNVNYIMFYFSNEEAEDLAIDSVQIEFKINKKNIGAR